MELVSVALEIPQEVNVILGQAHFIKTVEDLHEALVGAVPGIQFGLAFCEASEPALVRASGTDAALVDHAKTQALRMGAGHVFVIFLRNAYPINVLNAVKNVPEVCQIFCATANPVEVVLAETDLGRGVVGVIDGIRPKGVETEDDVQARQSLLRRFGYKA
ncbi:MAG TPA: adenosine-specific kinase [Anaerolineales bacterium]|nr:adenosine-specific kinase [Anaerolineales bacterium]